MPILPWEHVGEGKAWWLRLYGGGDGLVTQVVDPSPFFCFHMWEAFVPLLRLPLGEDVNLPKFLLPK